MSMFVIGDRETVLGLRLVGAGGAAVTGTEEARRELEKALGREDIKLLCITHDWADRLRDEVNRLKMSSLHPLVMEIPGSETTAPELSISEMVERAIGIKL